MDRIERTEQNMQELFHSHAAGGEGPDGEFMQILQGYIFGDVCYTGSLDNRLRELVTVTVLTTLSALPQLKAHVPAALNAGCTPVEVREAVYQCAPFIGFPKTLNAIAAMNEAFAAGVALPLPSQKTLTGADEDERYRKGLALQAPLYGTEIADRYAWLPGDFAQAVPRFLTELCFGRRNLGVDARHRILQRSPLGIELFLQHGDGRRDVVELFLGGHVRLQQVLHPLLFTPLLGQLFLQRGQLLFHVGTAAAQGADVALDLEPLQMQLGGVDQSGFRAGRQHIPLGNGEGKDPSVHLTGDDHLRGFKVSRRIILAAIAVTGRCGQQKRSQQHDAVFGCQVHNIVSIH